MSRTNFAKDQLKSIVERIERHVKLGCTLFVIEFFGKDTREPARLFAEQVMPRFR